RAGPPLRAHPLHLLQPRDPGGQYRPAARQSSHRTLRAVRPVPLDPSHGKRRTAGASLGARSAFFQSKRRGKASSGLLTAHCSLLTAHCSLLTAWHGRGFSLALRERVPKAVEGWLRRLAAASNQTPCTP